MKTFVFSFFALAFIMAASPAFAIDQVTLTNGQVVQGTVLNDVPNLYVDIRLINGDTKRFQHSEVSSVDRDVPSRKDNEQFGNQSTAFVSVNLGGYYSLASVPDHNVLFDYGIKVGVITGQLGDSKIAFDLNFDRTSQSVDLGGGVTETAAYNDLNLEMLFMRMGNSGFYIGPNIGMAILTDSADDGAGNSVSVSKTYLEVGVGLGYDAYLSDTFSIGPNFRYEHVFSGSAGNDGNVIKFAVSGSYHF
jgi:hypothetical protein